MTTITVAQALTTTLTGQSVFDTEANVFANLPGLLAKKANIASIALSDDSPSATITTVQLLADAAILGKISTHYALTVTGAPLTVAQVQTLQTALAAASGSAVSLLLSDVGPHGLTVSDTATNLAALTVAGATLLANQNIAITTTATVAQLTAIQAKVVTATLAPTTIGDTTANLVNGSGVVSTFVKPGVAVTMTTAATIAQLTAIHAANTTGTLTANIITDTAANLFGGTGVGPLSTFVKAGVAVTVTTPATIAQLTAIHSADTTGTVTASTIVDSVANFTPANITLYVKTGVHVTVNDNVADLVAAAAVTGSILTNANTTAIVITDSLVNVAASLHALTALKTATRTVTATMTATAAQLLDSSNASALALETSVTLVADLNGANTVTVAQANTLEAIKSFNTGGFLTISDTAANLTSSAAQALITKAGLGGGVAVQVSDSAKVTVAAIKVLVNEHATLGSSVVLTISDTAANLHANAAYLNTLAIPATITITGTLSATDLATLLADMGNNSSYAASLNLSGVTISGVVTVAQITMLNNAHFAGAYTLQDTAYCLIHAGASIVLNAAHINVTTLSEGDIAGLQGLTLAHGVVLNLSTVTASVSGLSMAEAAWAVGHKLAHYGLSATAADLLSAANATVLTGATAVTLASDQGSGANTVTVAQVLKLETLVGFTAASGTLTIADTVANLTSASMTKALAFAHVTSPVVQIDTSAVISVATLAKLHTVGATATGSAVLTLQDTTANVLTSTGINATVQQYMEVAGVTALSLTGSLTGVNLTALDNFEQTLPSFSVDLTHAVITGTLTVAQATLAVDGHYTGGYSITDTASDVLNSNVEAVVLSGASTIFVSGHATATQFETLVSLHHTNLNLASLTINCATAAQLLDPSIASHLYTSVSIDPSVPADNVVTVAEAAQLHHIIGFIAGGNLTISDTVANLTSSAGVAAIAALNTGTANHVVISDSAVINAAAATTLATWHATAAMGVTVSLVDTTANIGTLTDTALSLATSIQVNAASDRQDAYNAAVSALGSHTAVGSVVLPAGQQSISLAYATFHDDPTGYVAALEAAGVTFVVTTSTQQEYSSAVSELGSYAHGSVSQAPVGSPVILSYGEFTATVNAAYVHALEAAGDGITVQAASNSLADYNAAVLALHGYGNGSVALVGTGTVTLTYNDFTSTANSAYIAALAGTSSHVKVIATSTSLSDYSAAVSAVAVYGHGAVAALPGFSTAVTLSYSDFSNPDYVAALENAWTGSSAANTIIINVTAASDSLTDYTQVSALANAHVSVSVPTSLTVVALTGDDYQTNLLTYVAAMHAVGNHMTVTDVLAANAAAVHANSSVISFTVTDKAVNLLDPANTAGVHAASSVTLAANDGADLGALTVDQAALLFTTLNAALNGNTYTISDNIDNLNNGAVSLLIQAATVHVIGEVTGTDILALISGNPPPAYAAHVNLSGATIDALTAAEAVYVQAHAGTNYVISDSYDGINAVGFGTAAVTNASTVNVTGVLTAQNIDDLSTNHSALPIDLTGATATLLLSAGATDAEAIYVHGKGGSFALSGSIIELTSFNDATVLGEASTITVTGTVDHASIDTLMTPTYSSLPISLSGVAITDTLLVAEASYAMANGATYTTISDSLAAINANIAVANAATTTVFVTGQVLESDILTLSGSSASYAAKIDLHNASVTLSLGASDVEAAYVSNHGGSYALTGTISQITAHVGSALLADASAVHVTGIVAADIDTLSGVAYTGVHIDLHGVAFDSVTVAEASYINAHFGTSPTIADTLDNLTAMGAAGVVSAATTIEVIDTLTGAQIDTLAATFTTQAIDLSQATISGDLLLSQAVAAYQYSNRSANITITGDASTIDGMHNGTETSALNLASTIAVTGTVDHSDIGLLQSAYGAKIDLSGADISLDIASALTDASYVLARNGHYSVTDSAAAVTAVGDPTLLDGASQVHVTGAVTAANITTLMTSPFNGVNIDLHTADPITDVLSVAQAIYANNHLIPAYATITDTYANIVAGITGEAAALQLATANVIVSAQTLSDNQINTLSQLGVSHIDLSLVTVTLTTAATAAEASFVTGHQGTYTVSGSIDAITSSDTVLSVLTGAQHVYVTDLVSSANIETLMNDYPTLHIDLSATPITDALTVAEAIYANTHSGVYATVSDTITNVLLNAIGESTALHNATAGVYVTNDVVVTDTDIGLLMGAGYNGVTIHLDNATVDMTTAATAAEADYVTQHGGSYSLTSGFADLGSFDSGVLGAATVVHVNDATSASNIATLMTTYPSVTFDLTGSAISDALSVNQAIYAHNYSATYATITDNISNITAGTIGELGALGAATTVNVTNAVAVAVSDLAILSSSDYSAVAINLSAATITMTAAATDAEADYVIAKGGHYTLTSTFAGLATYTHSHVLSDAATVHVTGALIPSDIDTLTTAGYAAHVELSGATVTGNLTVAQATYASTKGMTTYPEISDTVAAIDGSSTTVLDKATTITVTEAMTAAELHTLKVSAALADYVGNVDLSNQTIANVKVADAAYADDNGAHYSIKDTYAAITGGGNTPVDGLADATTVFVNDAVDATAIDLLASHYGSNIDLSLATVTLTTSDGDTEADYVHGHGGSYTLTGTYSDITTASGDLLSFASMLTITDTVSKVEIDALITAAYANLTLSSTSAISDTLTVAEAAFARAHGATYTTISDTIGHILGDATTVGLATTKVYVSDTVTDAQILALSQAAYKLNIDLSNATVNLSLSATADEANYVHVQHGTYSLSGNYAQITAVTSDNEALLDHAVTVSVSDLTLSAAQVETLKSSAYTLVTFNLSAATTFTGVMTVADAAFVYSNSGTGVTITDSADAIINGSLTVKSAHTASVVVTGNVSAAQIESLQSEAIPSSLDLSLANIASLSASDADFAQTHGGLYTITDSAADIIGHTIATLNGASVINVTGDLVKTDIESLSGAVSYASKVNLSTANSITLDTTASEADATYVLARAGTYVLTGAVGAITALSGSKPLLLADAATVSVTGAIATTDIDTLSVASYATKVNLSGATISSTLNVAEAAYAHAQHGSYTSISGIASSYASATGTLTASAAVFAGKTVTVTDNVDVAQLHSLKTATGVGSLTYAGIVDTAAGYASTSGQLTSDAAAVLTGGMNVTISGAADLLQLQSIQGAINTGVMTNNGVSDTAANLFTTPTGTTFSALATTYLTHGESVTLTGNGANAPDLAQLQTIKQQIGSGTLTYTSVSDQYSPLLANSNGFVNGNVNVTVTDTSNISIANLVALQGETGGIITATSITDTAANVQSNSSFIKGGVTSVTLYDTAAHLLNSTYATAVGEATAIHILTASGSADTISAANLQTLESEATLNAIDNGVNTLTISDSVSNLNSAFNNINSATSSGQAPKVIVSTVSTVSASVAEAFYNHYASGETTLGVTTPSAATPVNTSYNADQSAEIIISDSAAHILSNTEAFHIAGSVAVTGSVNSGSLLSLALLDPTAQKIDLSGATLSMSSLTSGQVDYLNHAGGSTSSANMTVTGVVGVGSGINDTVDLGSVSNASSISLVMGSAATGNIVVSNANAVTSVDISAIANHGTVNYGHDGSGNLLLSFAGNNTVTIDLIGVPSTHGALTVG